MEVEVKDLVVMFWRKSGIEYIKGILKVADVDTWEELKGKYLRVKKDDSGKIIAIGNILEDKWFDPQELFKKTK